MRCTKVYDDVVEQAESSSSAVIITMATPPHVIVYANPAWEMLCGWTLEEVRGRTCNFLQGPITCRDAVRELESAIGKHQAIRVRLKNYRKDGALFVNNLHLEPLTSRGHGGLVTHLQGTLQLELHGDSPKLIGSAPILTASDDLEIMRTLERVQPGTIEEAMMQTQHAQVITEAERPYRIVAVNQAWCELCGYGSEEAVGNTCRMLQGPGSCRNTLRALAAACEVRAPLMSRRAHGAPRPAPADHWCPHHPPAFPVAAAALKAKSRIACKLLNYRKSGQPFLNMLLLSPLVDGATNQARPARANHPLPTLPTRTPLAVGPVAPPPSSPSRPIPHPSDTSALSLGPSCYPPSRRDPETRLAIPALLWQFAYLLGTLHPSWMEGDSSPEVSPHRRDGGAAAGGVAQPLPPLPAAATAGPFDGPAARAAAEHLAWTLSPPQQQAAQQQQHAAEPRGAGGGGLSAAELRSLTAAVYECEAAACAAAARTALASAAAAPTPGAQGLSHVHSAIFAAEGAAVHHATIAWRAAPLHLTDAIALPPSPLAWDGRGLPTQGPLPAASETGPSRLAAGGGGFGAERGSWATAQGWGGGARALAVLRGIRGLDAEPPAAGAVAAGGAAAGGAVAGAMGRAARGAAALGAGAAVRRQRQFEECKHMLCVLEAQVQRIEGSYRCLLPIPPQSRFRRVHRHAALTSAVPPSTHPRHPTGKRAGRSSARRPSWCAWWSRTPLPPPWWPRRGGGACCGLNDH